MTKVELARVRNVGTAGFGKAAGFISEFKAFLFRGNVIDLAIAIVVGGAFTAIVNSLVNDLINPLVGLAAQKALEELFIVLRYGKNDLAHNTTYPSRANAKERGGVTWNYGNFLTTVINFFIIAFFMFLIVKLLSLMRHKDVVKSTDWPCPKCKEMVKEGAVRCSHCSAEPIAPAMVPTVVEDVTEKAA